MDWQTKLITIYVRMSGFLQTYRRKELIRLSANDTPLFTDEELLTVYLFGRLQGHSTLQSIHSYTLDHLKEWFPKMPKYSGFVHRMKVAEDLMVWMTRRLANELSQTLTQPFFQDYGMDSIPIVIAHAKRSGHAKVAREIANKGYDASKDMWYYGVKVHVLGQMCPGTIPLPRAEGITPASEHDLDALQEIVNELHGLHLYVDRAYLDRLLQSRAQAQNTCIRSPYKKPKGGCLDAAQKLYNRAVSHVRQPIESLFSWLQHHFRIEQASHVRSRSGLYVHIFGCFLAGLFLLALSN